MVNAGTALTVDALRADGLFVGGLIVPGLALMRRSLDGGTAQLRLTEGVFDPFPKSTPDAITTGSVQAAVGAIERMRRGDGRGRLRARAHPPLRRRGARRWRRTFPCPSP